MESSSQAERRGNDRVYQHERVEVHGADRDFMAQVMNKSEGGLRFYAADPFAEGSELEVTLDGRRRRGRILECSPRFQGHAVRVQFLS